MRTLEMSAGYMTSALNGLKRRYAIQPTSMMKGFVQQCRVRKPPRARYEDIWLLAPILQSIKTKFGGIAPPLCYDDLLSKILFLLMSVHLLRLDDIKKISLAECIFSENHATLYVRQPKEARLRVGQNRKEIFIQQVITDLNLCLFTAIWQWRLHFRGYDPQPTSFLVDSVGKSLIGPQGCVHKARVLLKAFMVKNGVPERFAPHSIRHASASALLDSGWSPEQVRVWGNWANEKTIAYFYDRSKRKIADTPSVISSFSSLFALQSQPDWQHLPLLRSLPTSSCGPH